MTLIMSVSGVRGLVDKTMTPALAADLAAAYGSHLEGGTVIVGRDSRPSGEAIVAAVSRGLTSVGCNVVNLGIASTPATAFMVVDEKAAGGIVVTASHNPIEWNGIKLLTRDGFAPAPEIAEQVFQRFREKRFSVSERVGSARNVTDAAQRHVDRALRIADVERIRARQFKVVLDSVNGAGGGEGRMLLENLGCEVVHVNGEPTGRFAHTPEPTADNLKGLCEDVRRGAADIGFAQDPDADRLAIVDDKGRYIGEEYTLALAAKYMLSIKPGPIAANLSTSRMVDDLAAAAGGVVHRTAVGEANVARAIMNMGCVLGGEGNGGIIDPRVVTVRDSLVGMVLVLNLLARDGPPVSSIVDSMPRYVMVKQKFEMDQSKIVAWLQRVRTSFAGSRLNETDGLRIDWPEGWVHLRSSNTEPIARVIAEAKDEATAVLLAGRVSDLR